MRAAREARLFFLFGPPVSLHFGDPVVCSHRLCANFLLTPNTTKSDYHHIVLASTQKFAGSSRQREAYFSNEDYLATLKETNMKYSLDYSRFRIKRSNRAQSKSFCNLKCKQDEKSLRFLVIILIKKSATNFHHVLQCQEKLIYDHLFLSVPQRLAVST